MTHVGWYHEQIGGGGGDITKTSRGIIIHTKKLVVKFPDFQDFG